MNDENKITFEVNEDGKPLADGKLTVAFVPIVAGMPKADQVFKFSEFNYEEQIYGLVITSLEFKGNDSVRVVYPWHAIRGCVYNANSQDYMMALDMFQETCNHVWDDKHHPFAAYCVHTCVICSFTEQLHHDDSNSS